MSSLRLWILLNREGAGGGGDAGAEGPSSASVPASPVEETAPAILLGQATIQSVLRALARTPALDVGDWITVLRSLKWLSSPRWLLAETLLYLDDQDDAASG